MRMLMNNLDPEVAERPDDLVVYGGAGRAARSWDAYDAIVRSLQSLEHDETLLVQSGKPVGVFQTHPGAPRVLIANALLVPAWATWENFRDLEQRGLTMYGQMTAGSWIYIGSQGIVQGTYETLAEVARRHFGGTLSGRLVVTAGLGGMGGAQPLAATMNGAAALVVEVDPQRIARRLATRYLDEATDSLDEALDARRPVDAGSASRGRSALRANAADVLPALVARGITPDVLTDQTSAHDALNGYVPNGMSLDEAHAAARRAIRRTIIARSMAAMAEHVRAMLALQAARRGDVRLRQQHPRAGQAGGRCRRVRHPRLCARVHPAALLRRQGTVPLGGALRRSGRHPRHRRSGARDVSAQRGAGPLDPSGARARAVPGTAGAHPLARLRRARPLRAAHQRAGSRAAASRRRSSSAAIISTPDRWRRPIARPKA